MKDKGTRIGHNLVVFRIGSKSHLIASIGWKMNEPPLNVATTAGVTDENIYDVLICNCEGDIVFLDICNSAYLHPYFQHFLQIRRTMQA